MKSDANRCFIGRSGAAARSTEEHNGKTASSCMRKATRIPLYYLRSQGVGPVLIATRCINACVLVTPVTGIRERRYGK
jgi:hypothetical protein